MSRLIGTLLINEYYTACFRRKDVKLPHFLYVDECHQFLSPDIARILDQTRKFGLSLTLAHQHLGHLREAGEHIFRSVMTNTLVKVIFGGLDAEDAEYMARLTYRGRFDLQRPKERLYRPAAVGSKAVWLEQESETENRSRAASSTWSAGTATTESAAYTKNRSRSATRSHTDNRSQTDSWSRAHGVSSSVASIDTSTEGQGTSDEVRDYETFSPESDPYDEHDFGSFELDEHALLWKIDYYDAAFEYHAEDAADPSKSNRVLTIMLAEEY